jgi:hypothetical protein
MTTLGPATAWGSVVYAGEAVHPETRRRVHVLGFQTRIVNNFHRANAVVLPIPSRIPLDAENIVDAPFLVLEDMAARLRQTDPQRGFERADTRSADRGQLSVVITRPEGAVRAIDALPANLQPPIDRKLFAALGERYPGSQFALCCWQGTLHSAPVIIWYEPLDPKALFMPAAVEGGHTLIVGSTVRPFGIRMSPSVSPPDPGGFLPSTAWGKVVKASPALDYDIELSQLHQLANVAGKHDLHPRLDPKLWDIRFQSRATG